MNRSKLGISPVVATVILVAVAIVIAIAVAFWASGLVGIFTRFEKLEITSAYATGGEQRQVILVVRNTGSSDTSIDDIYVNGIPCNGECGIDPDISPSNTYLMKTGSQVIIQISNPPTLVTQGSWTSGISYEVSIHTASGKSYPVAVLIP